MKINKKKGLGKKLMEVIVNNDELKELKGIPGTKDAHSLYEKYGFVREGLMTRKLVY
jgi:hypothetical protein